jgi:hypothetical protein
MRQITNSLNQQSPDHLGGDLKILRREKGFIREKRAPDEPLFSTLPVALLSVFLIVRGVDADCLDSIDKFECDLGFFEQREIGSHVPLDAFLIERTP